MPGHWRFRKSVPLGPFRLNFNRRSTSLTAGRRRGGPHVTVNTRGETTSSVGLPGTGLSYRWTTSARQAPAKVRKVVQHSAFKWWALIVSEIVIAFVVLRWFL